MSVGVLLDIGKSLASFDSDLVSIDLDVNLDEVHEWTNEVTSNPVELGAPITDHIQPLPDAVKITGVITNSAISEAALKAFNNKEDRVFDAFQALLKIKEDRLLVTVYTKYRIYTDMAIKSINIPRDAKIGDSIKFSVDFIHVRIVTTQIVDVPPGISRKLDKKLGTVTQRKTEPQKQGGKKETEKMEDASVATGIKEGVKKVGEKFMNTLKGASSTK